MLLPKAILFDLDDTIVSFSAGPNNFWYDAYKAYQERFQHISDRVFLEAIRLAAGDFWSDPQRARRGRLDLFWGRRQVAKRAFERLDLQDQNLQIQVADFFTEEKEKAVAPFPKAIDTLDVLSGRGVQLGLISNGSSEFQRRKLHRFNLERYFKIVLIEGEFGVGKPDERVFLEALKQLEVTNREVWMVGDNLEADIGGAQKVGIFSIWNDYKGSGLKPGTPVIPDRIIRQVADLV